MALEKCLITGAYGQDALLLAPYMQKRGFDVYATDRRRSRGLNYPYKDVTILRMDLTDIESVQKVIKELKPDCIFNLAAQSHVSWSFNIPRFTFETNMIGVLTLLEAIKEFSPETRFYQASTSEMIGNSFTDIDGKQVQDETTSFSPQSPYGVAKTAAFHLVKNYREAYGLRACSGILFNHESRFRGKEFLTMKVCDYIRSLKYEEPLQIGNISAERDWMWAEDAIDGMYRILYQDIYRGPVPFKDYVLGSGKTMSVKDFVDLAFKTSGQTGHWEGEGLDAKYILGSKAVVVVNKEFYRPSEVHTLIAYPLKAYNDLKWKAKENTVELLIKDMLQIGEYK